MPMALNQEGSKENFDASSGAMLPKKPKATNTQNNIAGCADKDASYIGSCSHPSYENSIYQSTIDSFLISGLCPNFDTAATILRLARQELRLDLIDNENSATSEVTEIVSEFYSLLQKVEIYMNHRDTAAKDNSYSYSGCDSDIRDKVFIVEIEGLDGSGKTTLCRSLTEKINDRLRRNECNNETNPYPTAIAIATKTPSPSLKQIRPLFDHRGGIVARAFYMVSNYILEYEIVTSTTQCQIMENNCIRIVIVDRWYASTLAYTVAYETEHKNCEDHSNDGSVTTEPDVEQLSKEVFAWPEDLYLFPNILLILQIEHDVRKARVENRKAIFGKTSTSSSSGSVQSSPLSNDAAPSLYNPWDDRLDRDVQLGQRILSALSKVHCENKNESTHGMMVRSINANHSIEEVLDEAIGIVIPECLKFTTEGKLRHDDTLLHSQSSCLGRDSTSRSLRTFQTPVLSKLTTPPILTVVLTGCHASGKTTIGRALAEILGWRFDPELGEILRGNEDNLQPGGHLYGDGSAACDENENRDAWDDIVFAAEKRRDIEALGSKTCRIVETWHVGNANWYALRQRSKDHSSDDVYNHRDINIDRYTMAVKEHKRSSLVLLVHLDLPSSTVVLDRRRQDESARKRVPLKNEMNECEDLFQALQPRPEDMCSNLDEGKQLPSSWNVPTLHINNGSSGSAHIDNTIELILTFIEENYNRYTQATSSSTSSS